MLTSAASSRYSEALVVVMLLVLAGALAIDHVYLHRDVATLLDVGARLADGQIPYVDYVETNPPLAHYLNAIVVILARAMGVEALQVLWASTFCGLLLGALCLRNRGAILWGQRPAARMSAAFVGAHLFIALVGNWGQREQLFVLLFTPWMVVRHPSSSTRPWWAFPAAVAAAIGVCIKPHFLLVPVLLELHHLLTARRAGQSWFDPSLVVFSLVGLAYPLHLLFVPDSMFHAYFSIWVPMLVQGYQRIGTPIPMLLAMRPLWLLVIACTALSFFSKTRGIAMAAFAGLFIYVLQYKFWFYHLIPGLVFSLTGVVGALPHALSPLQGFAVRLGSGLVVLLAGGALLLGLKQPRPPAVVAVFDELLHPGDSVLVLSTALGPTYPFLRDMELVSTYPCHFPLAILFPEGHKGSFGAPISDGETVFRADLAKDLGKNPTWILLSTRVPCWHCREGVDFPSYLADIELLEEVRRNRTLVRTAGQIEFWRLNPIAAGSTP